MQQQQQQADGTDRSKPPTNGYSESVGSDRMEMPMVDDDIDVPDITREYLPQPMYEITGMLETSITLHNFNFHYNRWLR